MNENGSFPVVIITGASSGLGAAVARRLAQDGVRLALGARRAELLKQVAVNVEAFGSQALVIPTDVRDRQAIHHLVQATLEQWGRLDVLFNNAGLGHSRDVVDLDPDELREQVAVNLIAVMECTQAVLPAMIRQKSGHIINVASLAGLIAVPNSSVYSATKFAVNGFTDSLRREVRGTGIRVSVLCPGYIATGFSPRLKKIAEGHPDATRLPGVMTPEIVAECVAQTIRRPRRRVILPASWSILVFLANTFPGLADALVGKFVHK